MNTQQLKGRSDDYKCFILSRYNVYEYIIECIKREPSRWDIYVSDSGRKK